mmetsp:Transcript_8825/g.19284  ORF Transcript_8825/g.19284 Transcript_8825/m.19284 type:complete len:248 (+) Transcript_8825:1338-2081(+)
MTLGHIAEHLSSLRANFQRLLNDLTVDATYGSNALSSQCCTSRIIEFERQHLSEILAFRLRPHHNIVNQNINRMGRKQNNPHPRVRIHSSLFADVYASLVYHDLSVFTNILSKSPVHTHFQRGSDQVALHEMLQAAQRLSAQDSRILWEFRHHIPPADRRYLYDMAHVVANQGCRPQRRHSQHRQNPNHIWCCFCLPTEFTVREQFYCTHHEDTQPVHSGALLEKNLLRSINFMHHWLLQDAMEKCL